MAWFGFWIFLTVYVCLEAWLYVRGHDTMFFSHRTPTEIALRDKAKRDAKQCHACPNKSP